MWKDFKKFAFKGNVMDLAIGVIIGGAFGKIITSVVNDIVMPIIGFATSGTDFKQLKWVLSPTVVEADQVIKAEAAILYGNFIQNVVDFFIIALCIFFAIRFLNKLKSPVEEKIDENADSIPVVTEKDLLEEIRDLLKVSAKTNSH
ncbi:MAG: large-conductance mechanosensitive channel protein MscL [Clostridiaceae bacterium]|jgi:large conductance mechanosensitive channel|nr:large-conductance mechanosensitive channel protein MscL [Clostridiaceae bacterium]